MTGEEQRNTIAALSEYLKKEGVSFFLLAYQSEGDLTCTVDAGNDLPQALAYIIGDNDFEEVFATALAIHAQRTGKFVQIDNEQNYNEN